MSDEGWEAPSLDGSPYVVFGPDRSAATRARTGAAVALATLPIVVESVQLFVLWQTAAFALVLAGVVALARRVQPDVDARQVAAGLVAVGALGVVAPAVTGRFHLVTGPPLLAVAVGLLAWHRRSRSVLADRQASVAAVALLATFAVFAAVYAATAGGDRPLVAAARATALALPFAAMLPLGGALTGDRRQVTGWWAVAAAAFAVVPVALVDLADPPTGLGGGAVAAFLLVYAVLSPLVGSVVVVLGRALRSA